MTVRSTLATAVVVVAVAVALAPPAGASPAIDPATVAADRPADVEQAIPPRADRATRRWTEYQQAVSGRSASEPAAPVAAADAGGLSTFATWLIIAGGLFVGVAVVRFVARVTGHGVHRRHA